MGALAGIFLLSESGSLVSVNWKHVLFPVSR